jgi:hypothetical protein
MGWNCMAVLSDSGDFLAFAGDDVGKIYKWDAAKVESNLDYRFPPSQFQHLKESGYVGSIFEWDDDKPTPIFNLWKEFILLLQDK